VPDAALGEDEEAARPPWHAQQFEPSAGRLEAGALAEAGAEVVADEEGAVAGGRQHARRPGHDEERLDRAGGERVGRRTEATVAAEAQHARGGGPRQQLVARERQQRLDRVGAAAERRDDPVLEAEQAAARADQECGRRLLHRSL
jgi:hypothetical protein